MKYGQKYIFNFDDMNPYYSYPVYNTEKEPKLIGYLCRGFHKEDDKTVYGVYLNRSQKFDNENNEIDENNPISNPSYTANCIEITTNHNDEPFKERCISLFMFNTLSLNEYSIFSVTFTFPSSFITKSML